MYSNISKMIVLSCIVVGFSATPTARAADSDQPFLLGSGIADVTGPARGMQMWGFVREGQITEGIHTRLYSRAFIIAEKDTPDDRVLFVSVDIGSITHDLQLEVVERLQRLYDNGNNNYPYTFNNVILSATHTHSGPGGYWHWGAGSPLGTQFSQVHFDAIVDGIIASARQAHEGLQPGAIHINRGAVEGAGANRSLVAYNANPADERARYDAPTDKTMTLLKLSTASGPIGMINWFASHPTAMTFDNRLISGDHKGHASELFEEQMGEGFVAAFAQSNCGDVTANLNLDNTGPGENEFETTRIIGERQFDVAKALFESASTAVRGQIESRQIYMDFTYREVGAAYTNGAGPQTTCPSAIGYSMAAGSTEDGGGHPMFKEGMTERVGMIDGTIKTTYKMPEPSDECRECHGKKPILFPTGETVPISQTQILPITITRIGSITLACLSAEVTTMSGRRLRNSIAKSFNTSPEDVIIVGYANDYGGYLTTKEEYDTQQYEGGHTLYGPWTLAAYQQEFDRLAKSMLDGTTPKTDALPLDQRGTIASTELIDKTTVSSSLKTPGMVADEPKRKAKAGDTVEATFHAIDPRKNFPSTESFISVEVYEHEIWKSVATDKDWSTKVRWSPNEKSPDALLLHVTWDIPADTPSGEYRIRYTDGNHTGKTRSTKVRSQ